MPSSTSSNKKKNLLKILLTAANCGCGRASKPSHLIHHPTPVSKSNSSHNQNPPPPPPSTSVNNEKSCCSTSTACASTFTKSEILSSEEIIEEGCELTMMNNNIAVAKESEEPYKDFRHSMLQMIFEKEIFSKQDLQRLLNCFLQLNSPSQHPVIIQAFTDICDLLISKHPPVGDED